MSRWQDDLGWVPTRLARRPCLRRSSKIANRPAGVKGFDPCGTTPARSTTPTFQSGRLDPSQIPVASARFALEPEDLPNSRTDSLRRSTTARDISTTGSSTGSKAAPRSLCSARKFGRTCNVWRGTLIAVPLKNERMTSRGLGTTLRMSLPAGRSALPGSLATARLSCGAGSMRLSTRTMQPRINATLSPARIHSGYPSSGTLPSRSFTVGCRCSSTSTITSAFAPISTCAASPTASSRISLTTTATTTGTCACSSSSASTLGNSRTSATLQIRGTIPEAFDRYRSQLDERDIKLNAASVRLTSEIRSIWQPDLARAEADIVRIQGRRPVPEGSDRGRTRCGHRAGSALRGIPMACVILRCLLCRSRRYPPERHPPPGRAGVEPSRPQAARIPSDRFPTRRQATRRSTRRTRPSWLAPTNWTWCAWSR